MTDAPATATRAAGNGTAIFEARSIVKRFGGIRAVNGATLDVAEGSITALIGPNGAGKTTFFNVITGFYRPDGGQAVFEGQRVLGRPPYAIARLGMVRTFQITKALARMPVIDNMMLAAPDQPGERLRNVIFSPGAVRRREAEVHEQAMELLQVFDLERLAGDYAGTLSGGQRKLLELARALMTRPRFLLLDEPMAGINPTLGRRLLDHMRRLRAEEGVTFLFIEHDMEVVMNHSDRVIVMAEGRVIAAGEPHEVRRNKAVIDAYLGTRTTLEQGQEDGVTAEAEADGALLATEDVVAGYVSEVDILSGVSIQVHEGEIATVIGPNGAGKSTLIKTIFGLLRPRRGHILFRGEEITARKPHVITRLGLSYVPQLDNVFPSLTVEENLEMGSLDRSRTDSQVDRMYELFPRLGERHGQSVGTMSGGERQMVAMARALMPDPQVLLLDEPSAGLAPAFVEAIFAKIEDINRAGVTIVMVEQNARRALTMSDRGYVLDLGANRFEGPGPELLADPKVAELYLGGTARVDRPAEEDETAEHDGA